MRNQNKIDDICHKKIILELLMWTHSCVTETHLTFNTLYTYSTRKDVLIVPESRERLHTCDIIIQVRYKL